MDLKHSFTVPATIEETWAAFNDIESVAGCFPGAVVTSVEGDSFEGTCKVKLGPIAMVYKGTGTFIEKDESSHTMKIDAKGKDKRGNGTAGAKVTATMTEKGGSTTVEVITDLNITGKPAQFGRGVMQDVSDKLLGQFVDCLQNKVGGSNGDADVAPAPATESVAAGPGAGGAAASAAGASSVADSPVTADTDPTPDPAAPGSPASPSSAPATAAPSASSSSPARPAPVKSSPGEENDALDLGATVIPILLKAYWKPVVALIVVIIVIVLLIKRL